MVLQGNGTCARMHVYVACLINIRHRNHLQQEPPSLSNNWSIKYNSTAWGTLKFDVDKWDCPGLAYTTSHRPIPLTACWHLLFYVFRTGGLDKPDASRAYYRWEWKKIKDMKVTARAWCSFMCTDGLVRLSVTVGNEIETGMLEVAKTHTITKCKTHTLSMDVWSDQSCDVMHVTENIPCK